MKTLRTKEQCERRLAKAIINGKLVYWCSGQTTALQARKSRYTDSPVNYISYSMHGWKSFCYECRSSIDGMRSLCDLLDRIEAGKTGCCTMKRREISM